MKDTTRAQRRGVCLASLRPYRQSNKVKTRNWLAVALALILVLCVGLALGAGLRGYGFPGGMMGRLGGYGFPGGMMGGWGWGLGSLLVMGLMWLVPLGFVALLALGVIWLVRSVSAPAVLSTPVGTCPACHKNVQADWQNCPHCGSPLKS